MQKTVIPAWISLLDAVDHIREVTHSDPWEQLLHWGRTGQLTAQGIADGTTRDFERHWFDYISRYENGITVYKGHTVEHESNIPAHRSYPDPRLADGQFGPPHRFGDVTGDDMLVFDAHTAATRGKAVPRRCTSVLVERDALLRLAPLPQFPDEKPMASEAEPDAAIIDASMIYIDETVQALASRLGDPDQVALSRDWSINETLAWIIFRDTEVVKSVYQLQKRRFSIQLAWHEGTKKPRFFQNETDAWMSLIERLGSVDPVARAQSGDCAEKSMVPSDDWRDAQNRDHGIDIEVTRNGNHLKIVRTWLDVTLPREWVVENWPPPVIAETPLLSAPDNMGASDGPLLFVDDGVRSVAGSPQPIQSIPDGAEVSPETGPHWEGEKKEAASDVPIRAFEITKNRPGGGGRILADAKQDLREKMASGTLTVEALGKMTEAKLAALLGVSRQTAVKARIELADEAAEAAPKSGAAMHGDTATIKNQKRP